MRGLETSVRKLRHEVFKEVAKVAYEAEPESVNDAIEAIPYIITPTETPRYRESIYRERAIAAEQVRLAMGMSLRPADKPVHITEGINQSDISDKYYEPPLMQVIPSACDKCPDNVYEVSDQCRSCVAKACVAVCPKNAISVVDGKTVIDQSKCIRCGKCKKACPYDAIAYKQRPCSKACGVKAVTTDELGRAKIDNDKCVGCGQCMVSCPFGAIADKSQIFQLIRAIKKGDYVVAEVAPAIMGQFGEGITPAIIKGALLEIGFKEVHEVASGADVAAATEAHQYVDADPGGENLLLPRQNRNRVPILQKPFVNLFQVLLLPFKLLHQGVRFRHIRRRDLVHISQFRGQDPAVQTPDGAILKGQKTTFSSRLPERVGIEQGLSGGG